MTSDTLFGANDGRVVKCDAAAVAGIEICPSSISYETDEAELAYSCMEVKL